MSGARAFLAGPGALRALRAHPRGTVEIVFRHAAYVHLGDAWLMAAERHVPFGPLSLTVNAPLHLQPGAPARVRGEVLLLGGFTISIGRLRESRPPAPPPGIDKPSAIAEAAAAMLAGCGPPPAALGAGVAALRQGRLADAVRSLAGLGEGLTPAGDDVLAGFAAWRAAEKRPVAIASLAEGRASPIGHAYLCCAERGELPNAAADLLAAIRRGSTSGVAAALPELRRWGSSSGPALAWGMAAALPAPPSAPISSEPTLEALNRANARGRPPRIGNSGFG